jgi:hypothetical protein
MKGKPLTVGDRVECRCWNSVDKTWNKESFVGEIRGTRSGDDKPFNVYKPGYGTMWLRRKEIKRVVRGG